MRHQNSLKISIIVPAYNEENYIGVCLNHIRDNANGLVYEIVVVDNASTDGTAEIVEKFEGVRLVKEAKKGLTCARQRGYLSATGDVLAYLDADTQMGPERITKVYQAFISDPDLVFLSGPYDYYDIPARKQLGLRFYRLFAYVISLFTGYLGVGGNMIMRKSMLDKVGGFDTSIAFYGEDTDIARRAKTQGKCRFMLDLIMSTSARRLYGQGSFKTGYLYFMNFLSEAFLHKPYTQEYEDFR